MRRLAIWVVKLEVNVKEMLLIVVGTVELACFVVARVSGVHALEAADLVVDPEMSCEVTADVLVADCADGALLDALLLGRAQRGYAGHALARVCALKSGSLEMRLGGDRLDEERLAV